MSDHPRRVYFGHHKCGSNWIRGIVEDLARSAGHRTAVFSDWTVFEVEHRVHGRRFLRSWVDDCVRSGTEALSVTDSSPEALAVVTERTPVLGVHVVRDPRDVVVSAYYSHLHSHTVQDFPALSRHRDELKGVDRRTGMHLVIDFLRPLFDDMRRWPYGTAGIAELKMEDFIGDDLGLTRAVAGLLDISVPEEVLIAVARSHSFAAKTGRAQGEEDVESHFRKGVAGDWRTELDDSHLARIDAEHPGLLLRLGY